MKNDDPGLTGFERRARQALEESVARTSAHVRSRLTQARHAAVERAAQGHSRWRWQMTLPAAGAVTAALLVAIVLWAHRQESPQDGVHAALENLDLLVDDEAFNLLVEEGDGAFYEWAASQVDASQEASG